MQMFPLYKYEEGGSYGVNINEDSEYAGLYNEF
jgi:hypothetical protein